MVLGSCNPHSYSDSRGWGLGFRLGLFGIRFRCRRVWGGFSRVGVFASYYYLGLLRSGDYRFRVEASSVSGLWVIGCWVFVGYSRYRVCRVTVLFRCRLFLDSGSIGFWCSRFFELEPSGFLVSVFFRCLARWVYDSGFFWCVVVASWVTGLLGF